MEKNSERAGVGAVELTTAMAQMKDAKNQKPSGGEEQKWVPKIFWRICITNLQRFRYYLINICLVVVSGS